MQTGNGWFRQVIASLPIVSILMAIGLAALLPMGLEARNPPYHAYGGLVLPNWVFTMSWATLTALLPLISLFCSMPLWRKALALLSLPMALFAFDQLGEVMARGSQEDVCFPHLATVGLALSMYVEDNGGTLPTWTQLAHYLPAEVSLDETPTPLPWYAFWVHVHRHRHSWNNSLAGRKVSALKKPLIIAYDSDPWPEPRKGRACLSVENKDRLNYQLQWIPESEWKTRAKASGIR